MWCNRRSERCFLKDQTEYLVWKYSLTTIFLEKKTTRKCLTSFVRQKDKGESKRKSPKRLAMKSESAIWLIKKSQAIRSNITYMMMCGGQEWIKLQMRGYECQTWPEKSRRRGYSGWICHSERKQFCRQVDDESASREEDEERETEKEVRRLWNKILGRKE